jgi:hypothetical protein
VGGGPHGRDKIADNILVGYLEGKRRLGTLRYDGSILLKFVVKWRHMQVWAVSSASEWRPVEVWREHSNELSNSMKFW